MTYARKSTGSLGEDLAADFLRRAGYKILERNLKTFFGEIDILAERHAVLVLVEVKTKRGAAFGLPQEMVHRHKQHKLRQLALWLTQKYPARVIRVDVVAVSLSDPARPAVEHLENILNA